MYQRIPEGKAASFEQDIRACIAGLRQLDSLPSIAMRAIEVAEDDRTSRKEIVRLLEADSGLAAKVIKVANSAWLGCPGEIRSLDRAMAMLGFDMLRNIALSVVVSQFFLVSKHTTGFRIDELWHHCLACGVACEQLARFTGLSQSSEAFVAGLLHDLGKIILLRWNAQIYSRLVEHARDKQVPLHKLERQTIGLDHGMVGGMLLEDWNFPGRLQEAVAGHHNELSEQQRTRQSLVLLVQCANALCHQRRFGFSGHSMTEMTFQQICELLELKEKDLKEASVEVVRRFDEAASLFGSSEATPELYLAAVARANQELSWMYEELVRRTKEHDRAESELRQKEEQLNRAQRLEAVGQLAGGIAHDFNNFLTVIMGFGDLLREGLPNESQLRPHVDTIMSVAERAATLTGQLLAFSRRQVLKPQVLILNSIISDVQKLLVRLIGEDIKLTTSLDPALKPVRVDPGGIEQVIVNLAVNARDAMLDGGVLTVSTANVELSPEYTKNLSPLPPGRYVNIKISDTGLGMSKETQQRIFEPFFTTKRKGTGMGLATVYGIVKQSGGYIYVESEVGQGTTFNLYFQPVDQEVDHQLLTPKVESFQDGTETILIAEDEHEILELVERILRNVGYRVLTARNGEEALKVAADFDGPIHLLLTDAVMPVINGRELVERLRPQRPNMRVMFMSGYTGSGMLHRAVAGQDIVFVSKPFTPHELLRKVQGVLHRK